MAIDELQLIAQARADLMLRGHAATELVIGKTTARRLAQHHGDAASEVIFQGRVTVTSEIEGFMVRPAS